MADECVKRYHGIDILVNNVGIGIGDAGPVKLSEDDWDHIFRVNLKAMFLTCKYVLPVMEQQERGSIINISSVAAVCAVSMLAYKTSKAGVNALTHSVAMKYAKKGIRVNAIMPGLMKTPMAIEGISQARGIGKDELIKMRDKSVPLKGGMGDAWDTAYAALFLASDEAKFITSVILPVDGGQCAKIG
jgi:NAD(P)-dependent dehydrogenase (short-subunit alcohol dehydrogenase family)